MGLNLEFIKNIREAIGYWFIGGCFAIFEIVLLFLFVDVLGFKAWIIASIWIFGGAIARYEIHKWYLVKRNVEVVESG